MASLAAQIEPLPGLLLWIIPIASLLICWRLGIFRPVVNPMDRRLAEDESPWWLVIALLAGAFVGTSTASMVVSFLKLDPEKSPVEAQAVLYTFIFLALAGTRVVIRADGLQRLGLSPFRLVSAVPWAVIAILLTLPVVYAAGAVVEAMLDVMHMPKPKPHLVLTQILAERNPKRIAFLVFVVTVLAPLAEETFFRALLQTLLSKFTRFPWVAIVTTAALFALVHKEPAFLFPLFVLGVGLGWVYERTGNLWATIFMHGLFNGFQVLAFMQVASR